MGDWSALSLLQVAQEVVSYLDLEHDSPLPDLFSFIHTTVKEISMELAAAIFITPQQYLELFRQFSNILDDKKRLQDEYQMHIINGLEKIQQTLFDVEQMREQLAYNESNLNEKNILANEKLKTMMIDQQEAERQKLESLELQRIILNQEKEIKKRKDVVLMELAEVEPLVAQAQDSVSSIKRQHLQELRTMSHPPEAVKITMESVCIMLGNKVDSWKAVQMISRKDDFIAHITNYNTASLSRKIIDEIESSYMNHPSFNFETVNRASKACGPLLQWVVAQVRYASILEKVEPLREEVDRLEEDAKAARTKALQTNEIISTLEMQIDCLRQEYSSLIAETQKIKYDMDHVSERIQRSMKLLQNLSFEKSRWESSRYIS